MNLIDMATGFIIDRLAFVYNHASKQFEGPPDRRMRAALVELGRMQGDSVEPVDIDSAQKLAARVAWVYSDIQLIARRIASAEPQVKREVVRDKTDPLTGQVVGTEKRKLDIGDHPFENLLRRPNSLMTGKFMRRYNTWWLCLHGNAYIFVSTPLPGAGEPQELWPLEAPDVTPLPKTLRQLPDGRLVIDYGYTLMGREVTLPGENIVHLRFPNPFDYWRGFSPLNAYLVAAETDTAERKWRRDFYKEDNAVPTAVVSVPEYTSDPDYDRLKQEFYDDFGSRRKSAFVRAGDLSVELLQQTLEQMEHFVGRRFNREEIDTALGVPQGVFEGNSDAETGFAKNTIQPLLNYEAEELTWGILKAFYEEDLVLEAPNVVPQDRSIDIQEYQTYGLDMSVDELRELRGRVPFGYPITKNLPVRLLGPLLRNRDRRRLDPAMIPEGVPSFLGAESPESLTDREATRDGLGAVLELLEHENPGKAFEEATRVELKRWRKVATKAVQRGRSPVERVFESDIIPERIRVLVLERLSGAKTPEDVVLAFNLKELENALQRSR